MAFVDDGVREVAGVKGFMVDDSSKARRVVVGESAADNSIIVDRVPDAVRLTPAQARRLVVHLNILASRVEERSTPEEKTP